MKKFLLKFIYFLRGIHYVDTTIGPVPVDGSTIGPVEVEETKPNTTEQCQHEFGKVRFVKGNAYEQTCKKCGYVKHNLKKSK